MQRLYRAHIETLHPEQIRMLEDIISERGTPTDAIRQDIMRIVHILMRGKGNLIASSTSQGIGTDELRTIYGDHPGLQELLASMERTIETTKRITKERDFESAIELLEHERALGFLPNIVTFKRLIVKTEGDLQKLGRIEKYILSEGITKNPYYNFYANLIKSGLYNRKYRGGGYHDGAGNAYRARGHGSQKLEENPKYQEAIQAGLSHDLAKALAQGLLSTKF